MKLTVAKTQPRKPEACDNCVGNLPPMPDDEMFAKIRSMMEPVGPTGVMVYNTFEPGLGTLQFTLHPACARDLA